MTIHACTLRTMHMVTHSSAHGVASSRSGTAPCLHLHRTSAADPTPNHAVTGRCGSCKVADGQEADGTGTDGRKRRCQGPRWSARRAHGLPHGGTETHVLGEARASAVCTHVKVASGAVATCAGSMVPRAHPLLISRGSTAAAGLEGGAERIRQVGTGPGGRESAKNAPACGQKVPLGCRECPLDAPAQ